MSVAVVSMPTASASLPDTRHILQSAKNCSFLHSCKPFILSECVCVEIERE